MTGWHEDRGTQRRGDIEETRKSPPRRPATASRLVIGSRGSRLALWQAEWTRARLVALYPHLEARIEIIRTTGDVIRDAPLSTIGGKGVFTKEIEEALIDGRIDLAVHSLKDLPTMLPPELMIGAVTEREDARDALVLRADLKIGDPSIKNLPAGAAVGTSSQRRRAQLKHARPDLRVESLRGNVDTRLRKLDEGMYDAVILAAAGLHRLSLAHRISAALAPAEMLPAVGQGALGIETRAGDEAILELIAPLNHQQTRVATSAERAFLRALGGGCAVPIAAHAVAQDERLRLDGLVASPSGDQIIRDAIEGKACDAEQIGASLAARLLERGASKLLGS
jgi:hydroxymethylbilane synthase